MERSRRRSGRSHAPCPFRLPQTTFSVFFDINMRQSRAEAILQYMQARKPTLLLVRPAQPAVLCAAARGGRADGASVRPPVRAPSPRTQDGYFINEYTNTITVSMVLYNQARAAPRR